MNCFPSEIFLHVQFLISGSGQCQYSLLRQKTIRSKLEEVNHFGATAKPNSSALEDPFQYRLQMAKKEGQYCVTAVCSDEQGGVNIMWYEKKLCKKHPKAIKILC